jgi:hypothetical protein
MHKGFGALVGALVLTLLCATAALAQDYVVPVIVGGKTYTLTVGISGSTVKVASSAPEVKVGAVQPAPKVADATGTGTAAAQSEQDAQAQMATAVTIEYDDLFRNNEQHVGKVVRYVGKVLQYGELSCLFCDDPGHYLRVGMTNQGYGLYGDPIYVLYYGDQRFLEDDIVTVWGTVDGLESYTAVLGNEVTIPRIKALDVLLGEVSNPKLAGKPGQPSANRDANLRGGPGTDYSVVGSVDTGQGLTVAARNADGSWFQLEGGAWIAAFLVDNAPAAPDVPLATDVPEPATAAPAAAAPAADVTTAAAQTPDAAAAANRGGDSSIVPIGQEIEAGGWRFKVVEVHKRKAVYFYDDPYVAMGHFLIVIVEATNMQSGTDYFDRNLDPWLTDDAGNVYGPSGSGSSRAQWQYGGLTSPYENVNPGNFARVAIAYDLPDSLGHVLLSTDAGKWVDLGDFSALASEDN